MKTQTVKIKLSNEDTVAIISMNYNNSIFNCKDTEIKTEYVLLWLNILANKLSTKIRSFNCEFDKNTNSVVVTNKHNKKINIRGLNALQIILDDRVLRFI